MKPPRFLTLLTGAVYGFMYAPLCVLMVFSLMPSESIVRWEGFTLQWYRAVWQHPHVREALGISLLVTVPAVGIATALGTLTAFVMHRAVFRGKAVLQGLLSIPLLLPSLVMGLTLLLLFSAVHLPLGIGTMLLAHITFTWPLTTLVVQARMQRLDPTLEEAALDLGADAWTTFWRITFPLLRPGILAAALLAFPWSFNDVIVTFFVAGVGSSTLPLRIYGMMRLGVSPMVNALGTLLVLGPLLLAGVGLAWSRRRG